MTRYPALLALALAAPAVAQPSSEWLAQGPLPGFTIGYRQVAEGGMIVERVPAGETVQSWTRMVTVQRLPGAVAIDTWVEAFTGGVRESCAGARYSTVRRFEIEGRRAVEFRGDCPRNPATGLPETFFVRAIMGNSLHVAQVAFRRIPSREDEAWARTHLDTVTWCTRDIASPACRTAP